jgi:hypothetical protein
MTRALALLFGGLVLSVLGTATATDVVSLREVFHAVPVVGGLVTGLRLGMGTSLAHALEPATGVLGGGVMLLALSATRRRRAIRALIPVRA